MNLSQSPSDKRRDTPERKSDQASGWWAAGALGLLVLCCAAPALLAAGALGAVGAWLGNPWVIGSAVLALVAVVALVWQRHHRRQDSADPHCCPPRQRDRGQG
ncbi:hypothetical protein [Sciscionella marina]|uniref:hypothetical protein n=1 Tax=Sciscionella marina TaxID=508770 RepID=UPI0012F6AC87|nr:hypothetical protein [Sciscionella marina]